MTRLASALAVLPLATMAVAATGDTCRTYDPDGVADSGDEVELCQVQTYFHQAETKAGNLGSIDPSIPHGIPSWDTTAPTASVTEGAGGGSLAYSAVAVATGENQARAVFAGTFTGAVDTMDVDLHLIDARDLSDNTWTLILEVDGYEAARTDMAEITPVPQEGADAAYRLDFAFTNVLDVLEGDISGEHSYEVIVEPWYIPVEAPLFVYDTTEVPGGIDFNPEVLAPGTFEVEAY